MQIYVFIYLFILAPELRASLSSGNQCIRLLSQEMFKLTILHLNAGRLAIDLLILL